jgi:ABC-2 type transport system permease protein
MSASRQRVLTVARREFLTTVKRRAFLLTLIGTPAYFAFVTFLSASASIQEKKDALKELNVLAVIDSSGAYANAEREIRTTFKTDLGFSRGRSAVPDSISFHTEVRFYSSLDSAQADVRAGKVPQALVIPTDYVETGRVRRYTRPGSPFTSGDRRAIGAWLARNLVAGRVEPGVAARIARPTEDEQLFSLAKDGRFRLKDDAREVADFLVPMFFSMLLGISIMIGGQYLLQGVAEEKESRILESLMCPVSAEELMAGKLFGLGAVGLLTVGTWVAVGLVASGPALAMMPIGAQPMVLVVATFYFFLGDLFFGSIMTGIGAITNNMREAQQFAVWFTLANFAPFIMITTILSHPDGPLAFWLSLFPPTASTAMMMRLGASNSAVQGWQVVLSLALLGISGLVALRASARIFRIGLLMYGKPPTLPELIRWARRT